jgi:hypothetical protein
MASGCSRSGCLAFGTEEMSATRADPAVDSPDQHASDGQHAENDPSVERASPGHGLARRAGSAQMAGEPVEQGHHCLLDSSVRDEVVCFRVQSPRQRRIREGPVPDDGVLPHFECPNEDSEDHWLLPIESPGFENGLAEAFGVREWILPACEDEDTDSEARLRVFDQGVDSLSAVAIQNGSVV